MSRAPHLVQSSQEEVWHVLRSDTPICGKRRPTGRGPDKANRPRVQTSSDRNPASNRVGRRGLLRTSLVLAALTAGGLALRHFTKARLAALLQPSAGGTTASVELDFREVRFQSTDGLALTAWWVPKEGSSRVAVLAHGRSGNKSSTYVVETASIYARAGFNVLMLDLRSRGGSEGRFLTAGYQEVRDVRGALSWLAERGFDAGEVVLHGWSTGAVTVVRTAPGTGVAAVVEEGAYADLPLLLGSMLPGNHGRSDSLSRVALRVARLLGVDFDPWALQPRKDAAKLSEEGVPLLIIHSRDDAVIPFGHAGLLAAAHPGATFWEIEGYAHMSACSHPEYPERLLAFLNEAVGTRRSTGATESTGSVDGGCR